MFRKAVLGDYESIKKLKDQIHTTHILAEPKYYKKLENGLSKEYFASEVEKENVYVLEEAEVIIGYSFISYYEIHDSPIIHNQKIMMIDDFCIDSTKQQQGYGKQLYIEVEKMAKENKANTVELVVWDFNENAKQFYEKIGMRPTRIRMMKEIE